MIEEVSTSAKVALIRNRVIKLMNFKIQIPEDFSPAKPDKTGLYWKKTSLKLFLVKQNMNLHFLLKQLTSAVPTQQNVNCTPQIATEIKFEHLIHTAT